jgi:hypothetical protein
MLTVPSTASPRPRDGHCGGAGTATHTPPRLKCQKDRSRVSRVHIRMSKTGHGRSGRHKKHTYRLTKDRPSCVSALVCPYYHQNVPKCPWPGRNEVCGKSGHSNAVLRFCETLFDDECQPMCTGRWIQPSLPRMVRMNHR